MDLTSSCTHTIQTFDADTKTTPPVNPTNNTTPKSLSFTNGTPKRHPSTTAAPPPQPPSMVVTYKECLKNHAASLGGHALDGCGEFMPSSSTNPTDPRSLKCAACGCHRNFHRRDPQEHSNLNNNNNIHGANPNTAATTNNNPTFLSCIYTPSAPAPISQRAMSQSTSPSLSSSPSHSPSPMSSPSPPPLSHVPPYHASAPHMLLALGTGYSTPSDERPHHRGLTFSSVMLKSENPKKRYRTKFSKEQKEKMQNFSEKLGWRMQKGDDGLVQQFCNDIGVSRGVFKVWMHNNKNTFRRRLDQGENANPNANANSPQSIGDHDDGNNTSGGGGFDSDINNPYNPSSNNNDIHMNEGDGCGNVHVSLNGLSS
ncbi:zinc-finger homeodomain protein 11-like [Vigna umbellata]|uniref:zinc-finger homeodomain protein 11-like n=1 Tax=Vigna umbellata TaxID=87088 RepID=UPI001F5E3D27|nr:zinc-finger homeodomain protein 11-like [Vigna umbellata]